MQARVSDIRVNTILKRLVDISVALFIIIFVLSWFIPIMALLIKLNSKGPVFFIQKRSGLNNSTFYCYKLRTMYINSAADHEQATENDSRITSIGKFLRNFSIDELPQFFNVFFGDMSIIGPRPHMINHTELYSKVVDNYMDRLHVRPGITGLSQVMGYRGEIKNKRMIRNRIRFDLYYINNWSIGLELFIAFKTISLMLFGDRKNRAPHENKEEITKEIIFSESHIELHQ